ncbi:MAG: MFS transporter [Planctomycetota bacterium]
MTRDKSRRILGLVFLTVLLDIVGFSVIFPLFPPMLEHYLRLEGEASAVGRIVGWLREISGRDDAAVVALFGGLLGSLYSLLQFAFAPAWGALSDRIGRRPTLLVTLVGTVVGYVLWIFAGSFALLVAARVAGGIMAGNISTATAVVADTTSAEKRAHGMGIVGMAIGLGFILGPVVAVVALLAQPEAGTWRPGFALNPFSAPAIASSLLAVANLSVVAATLPETLPPERRGRIEGGRIVNPFARLSRLRIPGLTRTILVYFVYLSAFAGMEFTLTFLAAERFDFRPREITAMFVFIGVVLVLVQGALVRRLVPRQGEKRVALEGLAFVIPGLLLVGEARSVLVAYAGLLLMAVGSGLLMPSLSALASHYAPAAHQGIALGAFRASGALSRAIGPAVAGVLYWQLGSAAPYRIGAVSLFLPLALALGLPPVPAARNLPRQG